MEDNDDIIDKPPATTIMIALYYIYIEIPWKTLDDHKEFHTATCSDLHLLGRIRISTEGINGVLSGTKTNLESYEEMLKKKIADDRFLNHPCSKASKATTTTTERYGETLDIKYCHLRNDLPIESQTFQALSVKITREVVSLNETSSSKTGPQSQGNNSKRNSRRRRRGRNKKNPRNAAVVNEEATHVKGQGDDDNTVLEKESKNQIEPDPEPEQSICLDNFEPANHLTPQEWNKRLLLSTQHKPTISHNGTQTSDGDGGDLEQKDMSDAIIIDARNVYESRIGHFAVDGVPTLLTNTRKYSSISTVLNASIPHIAGKDVYMYCTGGVRCERASVYVQALAQSDRWPKDLPKPKQVYQLQGGIQKYLETYGTMETPSSKIVEGGGDEILLDQESSVSENLTTPCLYKGKNFVFDPRRYDPKVGQPGKPGKCTVCACPHDDYDNGYAPCENKETRCCRCRVLVLVCYGCRDNVRVRGETNEDRDKIECNEGRDDPSPGIPLSVKDKPQLFCGPEGKECIDDGNKADHFEIVHY